MPGGDDLLCAVHEIHHAGPERENARDCDRPDERNPGHIEQDPQDGDDLREGGDFPGPVRENAAESGDVVDQEGGADAGDVLENDQRRKPQREMLPPGGEAERDDGGEQQQLVCQRIEDGAEACALVEVARDPAIHRITHRRDAEDSRSPQAQGFVGMAGLHAVAVVDHEPDENRDEQDAEDGDLIGEVHVGEVRDACFKVQGFSPEATLNLEL